MHLQDAWHAAITRHARDYLLNPTVAMVEMIRGKSRFAVGYHTRLKLSGHSFDEYVVQDADQFVRDLAHSRWIVRGQPEQSALLNRLVAFGGPMFRVFSPGELDVIHAWIASLPADTPQGSSTNSSRVTTSATAAPCVPGDHGVAEATACADADRTRMRAASKLGARELYHRLLNHESNPSVFDAAGAFAQTWLARVARLVDYGPDMLPFVDYTHQRLRHWFEDRALRQAQSYAGPGQDIDKPREQVIEEAVQLCPMIFVDGGWVQRWTNAGYVETGIGSLLFEIFSDEIGNGDPQLNHPNIYRDLMQQMGIDLPDFRSRAFAMSKLFSDAAFEVPAFWLSISQFPRRFLPETLGLNLAMELSGVGGAYRTARDELRHYRFDTRFVDLHNTIDNVSTGHSAMALRAIELYMDAALAMASPAASRTQWRRVWTGFRALAIPRRSWKEMFSKPEYMV
ncbi:iron-containing redox enzyme family protein [Paraburkholderia dipogonis]